MNALYIGVPAFFLVVSVIAFLMLKLVIEEEKLARRIGRAAGISALADDKSTLQPRISGSSPGSASRWPAAVC